VAYLFLIFVGEIKEKLSENSGKLFDLVWRNGVVKKLISFQNGNFTRMGVSPLINGVFVAFALMFFAHQSQATQQVTANVAKIAVSDQSQRTQDKALKEALRQVIVKVSGNSEVLQNSGVRAALVTPQSFLRSYRFSYSNSDTYYVAEFDNTKLTDLLKRERLPLWGERRPETIVWLATESDTGERYIVDEGHLSGASAALAATAEKRGVPISFPLMDLTDNASISIYDVWGRFVQNLTQASQRYGVDNVIGARLYKNTPNHVPSLPTQAEINDNENVNSDETALSSAELIGGMATSEVQGLPEAALSEQGQSTGVASASNSLVDGEVMSVTSTTEAFSMDEFTQLVKRAEEGDFALDWVFIGNGKVTYGSIFANQAEVLTEQLVDAYANYLSKQYAVVPGANSGQRIEISISVANVDSLVNYAEANTYLNSLRVIEKAMLVEQVGSVATFSLTLLGTPEDLLNTVRLESRLQPVTDAYGQVVEGYTFYWNE